MCVTLTFEVWIWVKVNAHRLNEDNICTKLDGNQSMHKEVIAGTRNVTDRRTDRLTKCIPIIWNAFRGGGLIIDICIKIEPKAFKCKM